MIRRTILAAVCLVLAALAAMSARAHASVANPDPRAEALYRSAQTDIARNTIDTRRRAIARLEEAIKIDGEHPGYELALARAYFACGFRRLARRHYERVTQLEPDDADAHYGLGQVWRRDWLKYLEPSSLDRAIEQFSMTARLRPEACDAWLQLVPLYVQRGNTSVAMSASAHAVDADPARPEAVLALAHCAYRSGEAHTADSLFRAAVPRLPKLARDRFEDISPVATPRDTFTLHRLSPAGQRDFVAKFWRENDPDLSSPENEALLEYWSRVAQAYFLYFDAKRREWDERGEVYVRYGLPDSVCYNPIGEVLSMRFQTGPAYPVNVLMWQYKDLGMTVKMHDRTLSEYYMLPMTMDHDPDPRPDADSLAGLTDRLAVRGGRGVFPTLPPGVRAMPVHGQVARFLTDHGGRLNAAIETAAAPGDTLTAQWTVLDTLGHEVERATRSLAQSACDPTDRGVADFAADLTPGKYLVGLSIRDNKNRRGVYRAEVEIEKNAALALSDVVVTCGPPAPGNTASVRLEPNPEARIGPTDPVTAYFEVYHLTPDSTGLARFEYVYTIRTADKDKRIWLQRLINPKSKIPDISATRTDEIPGNIRRQFITVPTQSLPPGRYRLDITVRDLNTGDATAGSATFLKAEAGPLRN